MHILTCMYVWLLSKYANYASSAIFLNNGENHASFLKFAKNTPTQSIKVYTTLLKSHYFAPLLFHSVAPFFFCFVAFIFCSAVLLCFLDPSIFCNVPTLNTHNYFSLLCCSSAWWACDHLS